MADISKVKIPGNDTPYYVKDARIAYGTCSTAAATAAKVVSATSFILVSGARIAVKFTVTNTAANPTLNVNNTGAKAIYYRGSAISAGTLAANRTYEFVYNSSSDKYELIGDLDSNSDTYPAAYCSTAAATAAKVATCTNYNLLAKSYTHILITTANTAQSALTLNINGKGAKPIYINGSASSSSNYTLPAGTYLIYYDGTNYYFRTDGKIQGTAPDNHTHSISIAADSGTNQLTLAASTKYKLTAGGNSYIFTTPPNTGDTHYTTHLYAGSGTAANAATTNGNTKLTIADNTTVPSSNGYVTIKGTGATTVTSDANGVITINSTGNNSNIIPSAYCDTDGATAAKVASCTNYVLRSKSHLHLTLVNANTAQSALTLNINGRGAKPIIINNYSSSDSNYALPAGTYLVYYDGTDYYINTNGSINTGAMIYNFADAPRYSSIEDLEPIKILQYGKLRAGGTVPLLLTADTTNNSIYGCAVALTAKGVTILSGGENGVEGILRNLSNRLGTCWDISGATDVTISDNCNSVQSEEAVIVSDGGISFFTGTSTPSINTNYPKARIDTNGFEINGTINGAIPYASCSTAAGTAAKVVSVTGKFVLITGARVIVKFTVTNTAANPTLNVNSTGAKAIYYRGSAISAGYLVANRTYEFIYNGTQYELVGDLNSDTYPAAYCSTAAATAAKVATCTNYNLLAKSYTHILITTANTAQSALTLNINGKGAKPIFINGAASSSSNYTLPAGTYLIYYDGTNYYFRTDGKIQGTAPDNHTHSISIAADSGTNNNQLTLAASTKYKLTAGGNSYIFTTPPNTNTTYSSKTAANGGTDVSLVTTGEKYTWNNKADAHAHSTTVSIIANDTSGMSAGFGDLVKIHVNDASRYASFNLPKLGTTSTTAAAGNHCHYLGCAYVQNTTENADVELTYGGRLQIDLYKNGDSAIGHSLSFKTPSLGTTSTTAAAGNHTHSISIAADSGTNQLTLAASTKYKLTAGGNSYIFTTPPNTNTTYGISGALNGNTFKTTIAAGGTGTTSTVPAMGAASSSAAGTAGLVPAPAVGKQASFLRGDGTWVVPTNTTYTLSGARSGNTWVNTLTPSSGTATTSTVPAMGAASSSAAGSAGLVPAPAKGDQAKFLRADGTWVVPTNTTYTPADTVTTETVGAEGVVGTGTKYARVDHVHAMPGTFGAASSSAAGTAGFVPAPGSGKQASYLRGDGTWAVPTNTDTKVTNTLNTTSKAYITGTTSATTNTGTQVFDTGVYLESTAGNLHADGTITCKGITYDTDNSDELTWSSNSFDKVRILQNVEKGDDLNPIMLTCYGGAYSNAGAAVALCGGGLTVVGSGESAAYILQNAANGSGTYRYVNGSAAVGAQSEELFLASDTGISFFTNCNYNSSGIVANAGRQYDTPTLRIENTGNINSAISTIDNGTVTRYVGAVSIGSDNALTHYGVALGRNNSVSGVNAIAIGGWNTMGSELSGAFGYNNTSTDYESTSSGTTHLKYSYAFGGNNTLQPNSTYRTKASIDEIHSLFALGRFNRVYHPGFVAGLSSSIDILETPYIARNDFSAVLGSYASVQDFNANAIGYQTLAKSNGCFVCGRQNSSTGGSNHSFTSSSSTARVFIVGNGYSVADASADTGYTTIRSSAFSVDYNGKLYASNTAISTGADYAEFVKEWWDKNTDNEDRVGYMVTVKNGKLYKANEGDYIIGITSGAPSVLGNGDCEYFWRYERDEFNRIIEEEVDDLRVRTDDNGEIIRDEDGKALYDKVGTIKVKKENPNYDPSLQESYIQRSERPEWDYVGMRGIVPCRDDGTCIEGGFCKCGIDGIATKADTRGFDTYYVIERVNDHVISVEVK